MPYPSTISTFTTPLATDRLNSPSHSSIESAQNTGLTEIQTFLGTTNTSALGTIVYDVRSPDSNGGGHVQSANKGGTGQTSFTNGDILVAQSSSVLSKLAIGADGAQLVADSTQALGVKWGGAGNVQSFLGSGSASLISTWVIPSNIGATSRTLVELWGGGGSGGASANAQGAGGGGGGSYTYGWFQTSVLNASQLILVGGGGASVTAAAAGNVGGNTIFGATSLLVAYGGGGGGSTSNGGGGGGGPLGVGAVNTGPQSIIGGNPGIPISGYGGQSGSVGGAAMNSGGGGGPAGNGGNTIYGGAGGGGQKSAATSTMGAGGVSQFGGVGGAASVGGAGKAGSVAGGGGGSGTTTSGQGGAGKAIITTYI